MKIFLTEVEAYGKIFAGPNIIASSLEKAEQAAEEHGLYIIGQLDSIYVSDDDDQVSASDNIIDIKTKKTLH